MIKVHATAALLILIAATGIAQQSPEPFKVGTLERAGRPFVGIVLRDSLVIDFNAAHAALGASRLAPVDGMKDLIGRYDAGVRARIIEVIRGATGSDWVIAKNHDTFAPMGPFITPKEFVSDVGRLGMTFILNGEMLQTGTTAQMIHTVFEQVAYASNIMTLRPGDVLATGTPPGVGSARNPPVLLKAGDAMSCSYAGVGTLANHVVTTP